MKFSRLQFFILLYVGFLTTSCSTMRTAMDTYPTNKRVLVEDISYGNDPLQAMDFYLPPKRSPGKTPVFIYIHGGGWVQGDKKDLPLEQLRFFFSDIAIFTLNYRLVDGNNNLYPTAVDDVSRAVDFIFKNLKKFGLSDQVYIGGASAGAHLASLYTLKHDKKKRIEGCAVISGAFDLPGLFQTGNDEAREFMIGFLGGNPDEKAQLFREASPIYYLTKESPKFLILHGEDDSLTPIIQAEELIQKLEENNIKHTVMTYAGGHGIPQGQLMKAVRYLKAFILNKD